MVTSVSAPQARRIALAAQGFGRANSTAAASVGTRQLNGLIERLGLLQIDSVNVFERSHYLPVFARLGHFDKADLDRLTFASKGRYTEYWAHEAAIIPMTARPLFHWRMAALRRRHEANHKSWIHANRDMLDWLRAELADKGPLPASEIDHDANKRKGSWWEWSDVKLGLEYLFGWGEVVTAGRTRFERTYALAEQRVPAELLNADVAETDAVRTLIGWSARAHGIGTLGDLADYYRIQQAPARAAIADLVDSGEITPVTVEGWKQPAWLHRDARLPRRIEAGALLSPFDPVVWARPRAERMFDFHYRIEIYTPAAKRLFGYYSLPVLVDDALVGRIDLKNDRQNGVLRVQSAWRETGAPAGIEQRIVPLLAQARSWQGLSSIEVADRGNLARDLAGALGDRALALP
ncbi:MAG: winged helix-turn-helix protein [Microbacteriaceae bacterium]|nr:winged helix-turn-helix protein [Microbacteriaceae bacterium]